MFRRLLCWLPIVALVASMPAFAQKRIAFSFDDVPRHAGAFFSSDERTQELIAAMERAGIEQAGFFVTTGNLDKPDRPGGEARIDAYVAAGHVIANHTATHPWLWKTEVDDYIKDLDRAESWLKGRDGKRPWFRFPYLDEGRRDPEKRDALRAALKARGLENGYVTIDNYDWHLDSLASRARRNGETIDMGALRELYVETLLQVSNFYEEIAVQSLGRSPAHVILLHETDVAAMFVDDLAAALRADGWEIITIDEAYEDPIAKVEPETMFLGSGRVAALAHIDGRERRELVHERTDEEVLNKLFAERVLKPELKLRGQLLLPEGEGSRGVEVLVDLTEAREMPPRIWLLFDEEGRFSYTFKRSMLSVYVTASIGDEVFRVEAADLPPVGPTGEIDLGQIDLRGQLARHRQTVRAAAGAPEGFVRVAMWSSPPPTSPTGEPVSLGSRQFPPVHLGDELEWLIPHDAETVYFLVERPRNAESVTPWRSGRQKLFGPYAAGDVPTELSVD